MKDLAIALDNRPGALAEMGEALGRAGVSIEGGGLFVVNGTGIADFLFNDATAAHTETFGWFTGGVRVYSRTETSGIHGLQQRVSCRTQESRTAAARSRGGLVTRCMARSGATLTSSR